MTGSDWLAVLALALVAAGAWAASLYLHPFAPCRSCGGTGRNPGSTRRRYGECKRCKGGGRRQRIGARLVHRGAVSITEKARRR